MSKDDVLGLYLTLAPFGGNLEGVRAASLAYFGKEPTRLSAAEAALLVAIPRSPERLRPDRHPEAARAARDRVLLRMAEPGVISPATLAEARAETVPQARLAMPFHAPHLARELRDRQTDGADPTHDDRSAAAAPGRGAAEPRGLRARSGGDASPRSSSTTATRAVHRLCRQRRFRFRGAARHPRHGAGRAFAGLGAQTVHLRDGVRPAAHPSGDRAGGPRAAFRRLRAQAISTEDSRAR